MKRYYLTLAREYEGNTTTYVHFGCYASQGAFKKALTSVTVALVQGGNTIKSIKPYTRPDGDESWYIHIK